MGTYSPRPDPLHGSARHLTDVRLANPYWWPAYWALLSFGYASQVGVANRVHLTPIWFPRAMTISAVHINVTAGSAGRSMRVGVYADNGRTPDGGALLADSGNIDVSIAGIKTFTLPTPISFARGYAWLALATEDAVMAFNRTTATLLFNEVGSEKLRGCRYALGAWEALTNPCPATTLDATTRFMTAVRVDSIND